ncbi:MAG: hypothetical protein EOP84_07150 [Verrucomicrobiaceae bacterium]|nr:MAG: hypothetical protein EOP84_07150 [Verrucomicrobiaceae bacterium]
MSANPHRLIPVDLSDKWLNTGFVAQDTITLPYGVLVPLLDRVRYKGFVAGYWLSYDEPSTPNNEIRRWCNENIYRSHWLLLNQGRWHSRGDLKGPFFCFLFKTQDAADRFYENWKHLGA